MKNELTPYLPAFEKDEVKFLVQELEELYVQMRAMSANIHPLIVDEIKRGMGFVNNYYSNKIESEGTHPVEIEMAMQQVYSDDRSKELKQRTALAYQEAQDSIIFGDSTNVFDQALICQFHRLFYQSQHLLKEQCFVVDSHGNHHAIVPGEVRQKNVEVGRHLAPEYKEVERLLQDFQRNYSYKESDSGVMKLMKAFAAHHRYMFVHPFLDGNGRTGRLLTDAMLKTIAPESYGLWSLSRGLSRHSERYKMLLARADQVRQGSMDGRGQRSESGLIEFIGFMTEVSKDQVEFMSQKLSLHYLFDRIRKYLAHTEKTIPEDYVRLVPEILISGAVQKSRVPEILGCSERKARDLVTKLKKLNLLKEAGDSKFSPITLHFDSELLNYIFPDLVPVRE